MLIEFIKDFANNWKAGDIVKAEYLEKGTVLVDNIAKIDIEVLLEYCRIISESKDVYQRGFKAGYDKAFATLNENWELVTSEAEEKGRNEAWEVARKIVLNVKDGGMNYNELESVFGNQNFHKELLKIYTASEAIEKLRAYEEQKKKEDEEIHVGDEVYFVDKNHPRVVTCIFCENGDYKKAVQITENGKWVVDEIRDLQKTGRHFDAISEVLKKMKEGK